MADIVSKKIRSRMMSRIRSRDTKPELLLRKYLHANGFRYSLRKRRDLPCQPDLILPKYRAAIFVHGCFWHRHKGCSYATTPKTNVEFWEHKFGKNVERDSICEKELTKMGWRVITVWECELKESGLARLRDLAVWLQKA